MTSRPTLALAVLLPLLAVPADARGQTAADSLEVLFLAVRDVLGPPPLKHPAGDASVLCLGSPELDPRGPGTPPRMPPPTGLAARLEARLAEAMGFTMASGCERAPADSFGDWVVDEEGRPAVLLRPGEPVFSSPDAARVYVSHARAGRWGGGSSCTVTREAPGAPWRVERCDLLWLS